MNWFASLAAFSILLLTPYYLVNVLKLSAVVSGLVLGIALSPGWPARRSPPGWCRASAGARPCSAAWR